LSPNLSFSGFGGEIDGPGVNTELVVFSLGKMLYCGSGVAAWSASIFVCTTIFSFERQATVFRAGSIRNRAFGFFISVQNI